MENNTKKIYSNFKKFDDILKGSDEFNHIYINKHNNIYSLLRIFIRLKNKDTVIINLEHNKLFILCLLRYLFPVKKFCLISVDILLRKPFTFRQKISKHIKSILLKKVDIFVLYFKDTEGYEKYFGIKRQKMRYIPFKVNSWSTIFSNYSANPMSGDYVLCAGQTLRDLKTFTEAMRIAGVPGVLLSPGEELMNQHGTVLINEELPENLHLKFHTDGKEETFLNWIKNAALVVIPRFSFDISSSGIST
jgi:hypothetical protein